MKVYSTVGQHVDNDAGKLMEHHGERLMECHEDRKQFMECHDDRKRTAQALDKPRHHTAKDGVYGARGARLTHSDAGERTQLKVKTET